MHSELPIYEGPAIDLEKDLLPSDCWILATIAGFDGPRNNGYVILYSEVTGTKDSITISISELPEVRIKLQRHGRVRIGELQWWRDKLRAFEISNI